MNDPSNATISAGIDLGGTHAQIGLADKTGAVLARASIMTEAEQGHERVLERLAQAVRDVCDEANIGLTDLHAVGLGAPGNIDLPTGTVINAPNIRWFDVPAAKLLSESLDGLRVRVDNDVNAATLGECLHGAGRGERDALGVWVGTGIGAGIFMDGALLHGTFGSGAEIGMTVLLPDAMGEDRLMEKHASRHFITQKLVAKIEQGAVSALKDKALSGERITAEDLRRAWDAGDELVRTEIGRGARYLGVAVANALTMLPLPVVILGGGLTEALGEPYADLVGRSINEHLFPREGRPPVDLRLTELRADAGLLGACAIARG